MPGDAADAGTAGGGGPPLVTPKGKLSVSVGLAVGLSKDLAGKPIAITPDVFYGVAPKLEVGVAHSGYALDGFWGDSALLGAFGTGVCVTGEDGGCASVYNGPVGILARYAVMEGNIDLAVDGGLALYNFSDTMLMGLKVGVRGRKALNDKMMIGFAPNIRVGLNERDGNGEFLAVPVSFMYGVNEKLHAGIQTGIEGDLDGFGDNYVIPIALGAMYGVNANMSAGGAFVLHRIAGFEGPGAADLRSLALVVEWHN